MAGKVESPDVAIEPAPEAGADLVKPINLKLDDRLDKWRIVKVLGTGAFGAVYEAEKDGEKCALKVENVETKVHVLKMEVVVLRALAEASHACQLVDTGRTKGLFYVAMTLVGRNLGELRKSYKESRFTMGCAISVSMQCLEAIQQLHNTGYLHRDLKPANFAIGLTKPRQIFIFDFGMCRKFVEGPAQLHRRPRTSAGFRGTLRYASLRAHGCLELSRKDDLESWIYQTIELTCGSLPWSHLSDILAVQEMKQSARQKRELLFGGCPKEYIYLLMYVDKLDYYDQPKYSILRGLLRDALTANKLEEIPYDWEKE